MIAVSIFLLLCVLVWQIKCLPNQKFPCGIHKKEIFGLIRNGKIVDAQEHPWHSVVFHMIESDWEYQCGGTLINKKFIVTARHCTLINGVGRQVPINKLLVKLGLQEIYHDNVNSQSHFVSAIHTVMGKLSYGFRNDIALIQLNGTVQFSDHILPACLPYQDAVFNETGTVVGFGMTNNEKLSKSLRMIRVPVLTEISCVKRHDEFIHVIDDKQFCAGHSDGRTVCNGDSGGGLVFQRNGTMQLGGIVSYSAAQGMVESRCKDDGYAIYTNVYKYLPWIEQITTDVMVADLRNQNCGMSHPNATMAVTIYHYTEIGINQPWYKFCMGAVISQRYVLVNRCLFQEYDIVRVVLSDADIISDGEFSNIYFQDVESIVIYPASHVQITLLRLAENIVFDGQVQPICLPTIEELQSNSWETLSILTYNNSPIFHDKIITRRHLEQCKEQCPDHEELIITNNTNLFCLENMSYRNEKTLIGYYSRRNVIQQFVLLEASRFYCNNAFGLLLKLNFNDHIQWIYENIKP